MNRADQSQVLELFGEMAYMIKEEKCLLLLNKIKNDNPAMAS